MFGLFKKKPPTAMDALIRAIYGANPPPKSADLERSITLAHEDLLFERVPLTEVQRVAGELIQGPIPYSTHDLAVSTALGFFKAPEFMRAVEECQIFARTRVVNWAKDGKVVSPLAQSFEEVLFRAYGPNQSEATDRPTTNQETDEPIISLIESLLTAQLILRHEHPKDILSILMTNKLAAGYVFGFHDSCLTRFGRIDPSDPKAGLALMQTSYQSIFGNQSGLALFEVSVASQEDSEFQIGRQSGGEDYVEFTQQKTPPLGLQRILILGFDAAAVWRTLDKNRIQ
jgi:hypothetical protein